MAVKTNMQEYLLDSIEKAIEEQAYWILTHGGTKEGYIERYGKPGDCAVHGDGGAAIYDADVAQLNKLERQRINLLCKIVAGGPCK